MKKIKLLYLLITLTSISYAVPSSINSPVNGSGWRYNQHQTGLHRVGSGVGSADDTMAWDINYGSGSDDSGLPVYAVEAGTIYTENSWGGSSVGQLLVNHTTNGDKWSTGYLHMRNIVKKSGTVKKGDILGYISDKGTPGSWHLHFAVYDSHGKYALHSVDTNINRTSYPLQPSTTTNKSIFDGAGSLVSPNEDCYGCDKDIAKMHPHDGENSTVVFQWLYDADSCSQLDIYSNESIGDVIIKSKAWDGHLTKKAIKVKLNAGVPITIKRPDSSNSWTTFAVTTTEPLAFSNSIYADCRTSNDGFKTGTRSDIDKDLVDVTHDYFWSGTASLITQATERGSNQFGIDKDYAVTFESEKSLTSFQWYASSSCPKLKIRNARNASINSPINGVHIKGWAEENWSSNKCSSTLPCTLNAPDGDGYYVIKVKSDSDAVRFGTLSAVCAQ